MWRCCSERTKLGAKAQKEVERAAERERRRLEALDNKRYPIEDLQLLQALKISYYAIT